jgi:hypothetical protein
MANTLTDKPKYKETWTVLIILCILFFLIYKKIERRVESFTLKDVSSYAFWTAPKTHGGWLAQKIDRGLIDSTLNYPKFPTHVLIIHQATTKAIRWWNDTRHWWLFFLFASTVNFLVTSHLLFRTKRKLTHFITFRIYLAVGLFGTVGHLVWAPVTQNVWLTILSAIFYGIGLFSIGAGSCKFLKPKPEGS